MLRAGVLATGGVMMAAQGGDGSPSSKTFFKTEQKKPSQIEAAEIIDPTEALFVERAQQRMQVWQVFHDYSKKGPRTGPTHLEILESLHTQHLPGSIGLSDAHTQGWLGHPANYAAGIEVLRNALRRHPMTKTEEMNIGNWIEEYGRLLEKQQGSPQKQ
jgi:hypothetical protein